MLQRLLPIPHHQLLRPAKLTDRVRIIVHSRQRFRGRPSLHGHDLLRARAEPAFEVGLHALERAEAEGQRAVLVGELRREDAAAAAGVGRCVVSELVCRLGRVIQLVLQNLDDGDDGANEVELDDRAPGHSFGLPGFGGVFHPKVCLSRQFKASYTLENELTL